MANIYIDPGHGGTDPGAVNGALQEKNVNLEIALKLKTLLQLNGHRVYMAREHDVFSKPIDRANHANALNIDLYIAIHCNSFELNTAHGTETWYYTGSAEGERLADCIQKSLIRRLKTTDRGIKNTKKYDVLSGTRMTAVLVETAFISNPEEKAMLMDDKFREQVARAIYDGIRAYSGEEIYSVDEDIKTAVQKAYNFSDETMEHLLNYRFGKELVERLLEKIKGA